jgi:hypothetical protein
VRYISPDGRWRLMRYDYYDRGGFGESMAQLRLQTKSGSQTERIIYDGYGIGSVRWVSRDRIIVADAGSSEEHLIALPSGREVTNISAPLIVIAVGLTLFAGLCVCVAVLLLGHGFAGRTLRFRRLVLSSALVLLVVFVVTPSALFAGFLFGAFDGPDAFDAVMPANRSRFAEVGALNEGLAYVRVGKKWGYVDKAGSIVIKPRFALADDFSEGLALVQPHADGKYGYIDKTGKMVIGARFKDAADFHYGVAGVTLGKRDVVIDKAGKIVCIIEYIH